jgi:hypothetical protein
VVVNRVFQVDEPVEQFGVRRRHEVAHAK